MARPRKGEEKNRPIHLGFKVTEQMNATLRRLADKRGVPMSDIVVEILAEGLQKARERPPPPRIAKTVNVPDNKALVKGSLALQARAKKAGR